MFHLDFLIRMFLAMKKITKTLLRKVIKDVCPDPRIPGPFQVIADVGNVGYYEQRAVEALRSQDRILAIQLLILAQAIDSGGNSGSVEGRTSNHSGTSADHYCEA